MSSGTITVTSTLIPTIVLVCETRDNPWHAGHRAACGAGSNVQAIGSVNFDDLQGERGYSGSRDYNQSKLANVLFAYELARRLQGSGVTATVLHPGMVRTGFAAEDPSAAWWIFQPLMRMVLKSPRAGAATSIHLASAPEVEG